MKNPGLVPPIELSTVFPMTKPSSDRGFQYGRVGNPTRQLLEEKLATLHHAKHAFVFASGSAAILNSLLLLKKGDEVLHHQQIYEGTTRLLKKVFQPLGINSKSIDLKKVDLLSQNITPHSKLLWFESPTNPMLEVLQINKLCKVARQHNIITVVDNTLATALEQKPLQLGSDLVVESLTKMINGHSDAIGGMIATNDAKLAQQIKFLQHTVGAILSASDSWLIMRGLKTLDLRHQKIKNNKQKIVNFLRSSLLIADVFHAVGPIISFKIKHNLNPHLFIKSLKKIVIGHSFGGTETLIQQPTTMMDLSDNSDQRIDDRLFRLSIGLEQPKEVINDLEQALERANSI